MADNTTLNSGTGGDVIATDDIAGVKHQRVKVQFGADGAATDVSTSAGLPVQQQGTWTLGSNSGVDIGDVTINNATGASSVPVQGAAAHDAAAAGNPLLLGAEFDDTTPDAVDEGDVGRLRISANRNLYATIRDAAGNERGLNVDANGAIAVTDGSSTLSVDDGAGSLTVDNAGTFAVQAAQSGTWNVTNVSGTVSLPTGAATAAKQPALGTAGSASSDVITVQGVASMTALQVADNGSSLTVDHAALDNAHSADYDSGAGTDTTTAFGIAVPASGGAAVITGDATNGLDVDVTRVTGTVTVDGSGVTQPVSNAGLTALNGAISGTEVQVDVVAALPAGTNAIGKLAANSGVDIGDVDVTSVIPGTGATNLGKAVDSAAGATDTGVVPLAIRDDALSTLTPIEGDYVPLRVSSTGALHVTGGGGGTQYNVDDVASATATGTVALVVRKDSGASLAGTDGDITALQVDANGALRVTGGGGGTEYTVDAAAPAAPTGATFVMERDDALSALTEIEGDWTNPRASANGALWVAVDGTVTVGSHAVTNAGTFAVQVDGAALTALQLIDNPVVVDDAAFTPATTSVMMAGFEFDDTTPDSVDEGDAGAARMSANRNIYTQIRDAAGNERGANVNASNQLSVSVDNTVTVASHAVTNAGTFAVQAAQSGTWNVNAVTSITNAVAVTDNSGSLTVDNAGTFAVQVTSLPASTSTIEVVGDAAHDAAIAGNPVRLAGRALTSDYTAVAAGDTADLITTLLGKLVVYPYANPANTWTYAAASGGITDTTGVTAKAAAGAGVRNYITRVQVINGHATVSTDVQIRDGASGTVLWRGFAQAAGGGVAAEFDPPLRGTANTLVEVACGTTGSATYFNLQGFAAAE